MHVQVTASDPFWLLAIPRALDQCMRTGRRLVRFQILLRQRRCAQVTRHGSLPAFFLVFCHVFANIGVHVAVVTCNDFKQARLLNVLLQVALLSFPRAPNGSAIIVRGHERILLALAFLVFRAVVALVRGKEAAAAAAMLVLLLLRRRSGEAGAAALDIVSVLLLLLLLLPNSGGPFKHFTVDVLIRRCMLSETRKGVDEVRKQCLHVGHSLLDFNASPGIFAKNVTQPLVSTRVSQTWQQMAQTIPASSNLARASGIKRSGRKNRAACSAAISSAVGAVVVVVVVVGAPLALVVVVVVVVAAATGGGGMGGESGAV